jgi:hypothetical protein
VTEKRGVGGVRWHCVKPTSSSRGRGIYLLDDIGQLSYGEPMIVQRYLSDPLLLDGYKFDLRLYVLVTSFNPLEAFMYQVRTYSRLGDPALPLSEGPPLTLGRTQSTARVLASEAEQ